MGQNKSGLAKIWKYIENKVKDSDMYALPVSLNFKGRETFPSFIGGIASIFLSMFLIYYFYAQWYVMFKKGNTSISTNALKRNWVVDKSSYNMENSGFAIAINGLNEVSSEQFIFDPTYLTIEFNAISFSGVPLSSDPSSYNITSLNMTSCNDTFAKLYGQETSDQYSIGNMYCPSSLNFNIKGNRVLSEFDYFELNIKKWTGFSYWKSEDTIDQAVRRYKIVLVLTDYYFDVEDYDNPIKISLQNDYVFPFLPGYTIEK